jgi:hypothetical protein
MGTALATARVWALIVRIWLLRASIDLVRGSSARSPSVSEQIRAEVLSWPEVTEQPHRFGGIEFRYGRIELGHLHGDYLADLPFPVKVRQELVASGRALPHHILPASGWVSYPIRDASAVPGALDLFRLAYDRATARRSRQTTAEADDETGQAEHSGADQPH